MTSVLSNISSGVPLGTRQRLMPSAVEHWCYSFLSLADVAALFWACQSISRHVVEFLHALKVLRCGISGLWDASAAYERFALELAARFCRTLAHAEIECDYTFRYDTRFQAEGSKFLRVNAV